MLNSFAGLEMSKRALSAFRLGIQTAGHNAANVKTEGYSRQRVELSTTTPYTSPGLSSPAAPGQIGTGVQVDEIVRIRDEFLDFQYRSEMADLGYWEKINKMYETVQLYLAEPAGDGVSAAFNDFFSTLGELQKTPESTAIRSSVVESAQTLGGMLDNILKGYEEYASMVNQEVYSAVDEMNGILYDIASLNKEIYAVQAAGNNPNDLLDKRDLLLDELSGMIDIDIQEPFTNGDVTGEFFLTLNGRTLVQGDRVRELVAHAFQWGDETYYDVQVTDNEFDIVENTGVALALATGPEGVHQLNVYRLANGEEWGVGGADPNCLTQVITSQDFKDGIVISKETATAAGATNADKTVSFTVSLGSEKMDFFVKWNTGTKSWDVLVNGNPASPASYPGAANPDLTVGMLQGIMQDAFDKAGLDIKVESNGTFFTLTKADGVDIDVDSNGNGVLDANEMVDQNTVLSFDDPTGKLGIMTRNVPLIVMGEYQMMRTRPLTTTEALDLTNSFRIQVGTQGTQVASKVFTNANSDLAEGDILGAWKEGDRSSYTFRIGANDYQIDVSVTWNDTNKSWDITSDTGEYKQSTPGKLTVDDLTGFLKNALQGKSSKAFTVNSGSSTTGGAPTKFSISSNDKYLISISDVVGDLAAQMGMVNPNPVITIDVDKTDSLETIRNKINEKYQEAYGLTSPEDWVHASLVQDADQTWYLTINSNVPGEEGRITLMGDENGNMQTLRRLGLVSVEKIGETSAGGQPVYREVTAYAGVAEDAYFTFNGATYLSSDNKFSEARRVPAGINRNDYTASKLETVSEGLYLDLKGVGRTSITVRHHVRGGSVKALEEIRDGMLPQLNAELDELAWELVSSFNAYQYSGYGIGGNINTTGVEFFDRLRFKSGSASLLDVYDEVERDSSLIGAAMGKINDEGKAVSGVTSGSGSGDNAARMNGMKTGKLLGNGTSSLGEYYETFLADIGSEAGRAALMYKAQKGLTDQINEQRQAVMGVNIDEEMLDILMFNHAFNAMSRYATTIDEMLDRIINGFGVVGR